MHNIGKYKNPLNGGGSFPFHRQELDAVICYAKTGWVTNQ